MSISKTVETRKESGLWTEVELKVVGIALAVVALGLTAWSASLTA
jgi:hypothetical protein